MEIKDALEEIKEIKDKTDNLNTVSTILLDVLADYKKIAKRNFIIIIMLLIMLFVSNAIWIWTFSQYDFMSYEQSGDGNNLNNNISGDIYNNGAATEDTTKEEK